MSLDDLKKNYQQLASLGIIEANEYSAIVTAKTRILMLGAFEILKAEQKLLLDNEFMDMDDPDRHRSMLLLGAMLVVTTSKPEWQTREYLMSNEKTVTDLGEALAMLVMKGMDDNKQNLRQFLTCVRKP